MLQVMEVPPNALELLREADHVSAYNISRRIPPQLVCEDTVDYGTLRERFDSLAAAAAANDEHPSWSARVFRSGRIILVLLSCVCVCVCVCVCACVRVREGT
jgi:hypothetical protein